jgi:lipopolysaccharide biosynthesis regulator YciM
VRFDRNIAESLKAEEPDPLSTIVGSDLADSLHAGRYQHAINELEKILTMDPGLVPAHGYLSEAYSILGNAAMAAEEREKYIQLSGDNGAFDVMRISQEFASGRQAEARKHTEILLKQPGKGRFDYLHMAQLYVSVGD